jgi:3-hydroxyisobutyrate dehydrogenase-like beta-hydroxyacid dehydrogenase
MKVGWIGAGRMGAQMALCAARAGHDVRIFAREIVAEAELRAAGAQTTDSAPEAVGDADLVCLCVFSDDQAREVMFGPGAGGSDGALAALRPGAVLAIHTSGSPRLALDLAAAAPAGVRVIDAPFSGQQGHIRKGALTLLVGGDPAALETARGVFETYARPILHVGGLGDAQRIKLANQMLYRANLAAAEAALRAVEKKGVERSVAAPAMMACSGASFALGPLGAGPSMAERTRGLQPYLDTYLAAAAEDQLDLDDLIRRGDFAEEPADGQ